MFSRWSSGESSRKQLESCSWRVPALKRVGELGMYSSVENSA